MTKQPAHVRKNNLKIHQGFTLLELLIAVAIMGFIAVLCWQALDSLIRTRELINAEMTTQKALQRFFLQFDYDCTRIASEGPDAFPVMALKDGFIIVRRLKRAPLIVWQTVAYRTKDQVLWRVADEGVSNLKALLQTGQMISQLSLPNKLNTENTPESPNNDTSSKNFSISKLIENTSTPILRVWNHQLMQWELMPTSTEELNNRLQADSTLYAAFESPKALQIQLEIQKNAVPVDTATILAKNNDAPPPQSDPNTHSTLTNTTPNKTPENYIRTCLTGV